MPFRERMKRVLTGGSSSDPSDLTKTSSKKPKKEKHPPNVYKPGEAMPRPKYRGPYNQAHQDKLSAFSFGDAWHRRKSTHSTATQDTHGSEYSPMGSKLPSRGSSRRGSWIKGRKNRHNSGYPADMVVESGEGDDDVANVGLSRQHTAESRKLGEMKDLEPQKTITNGCAVAGMEPLESQDTVTNGRLFTEDELATAMSQSTLKPSKRERGA